MIYNTTYKFRLKDKHAKELNRQAVSVNLVWNYCNEAQRHALRWDKWLSVYELMRMTSGSSKELNLHAHTIQRVCSNYADSRRKSRKAFLKWRGQKSLGWVPFNTGHVEFDGATFKFRGIYYETMHLRSMDLGIKIGAGSFNRDSRGRWYINCPVEVNVYDEPRIHSPIGVDLGLKTFATLSSGEKIESPKFYHKSETILSRAQRFKKSKKVRSINAKISNRRKDFLHKTSNNITKNHNFIVIGNVSSLKIAAKPRLAKSVYDSGWADFKRMLSYKSIRNGGSTLEVSEAYTSQTCSTCGCLPDSRPIGIAGLGMREWTCDECGTDHDRDVNAARNILRIGLDTLAEGAHNCGAATAVQFISCSNGINICSL